MSTPQVGWTKQLVLALTLAALGSVAYWIEFKHRPELEKTEQDQKKIFTLLASSEPLNSNAKNSKPGNEISTLMLAASGKTFSFHCADLAAKLCKPGDNGKWELIEPLKMRGDDGNINSVISTLNNLLSSDTIELKDETPAKKAALIKEYGLDPESRKSKDAKSVTLITQNGGIKLYLGLTHPIGEGIFAVAENFKGETPTGNVDENRVYIVPSYFKSNLEHDLTYWRDKRLMSWSTADIASFKYDAPKTHFVADKQAGQWVIHAGKDEYSGDIENLDSLLSGLTFLNAKDFVANDKNDQKSKEILKSAKPTLRFELHKAPVPENTAKKEPAVEPTPVTVVIFQPKSPGKAYATVSNLDPLFEIDATTVSRFDKSLKDLRLSKLITSIDRYSAKKLEFTGKNLGGSSPLILTNVDGKWVIEGEKKDASADKVQSTLDKLSGNRIKDYVEGKAIPQGEAEGIQLSLSYEKDVLKRKLVFWREAGKLYGRDLLSKRNEAFVLDPAISEALPWDRKYYEPAPSPSALPSAKVEKK